MMNAPLPIVSLVNSLGETPYDLAVQYRHRACSDLLARATECVYPFWHTPRWRHYCYGTEAPPPWYHGTEAPSPWGIEDLCWRTKAPYSSVTGIHRWRSARNHYRCPDDIWAEFDIEAKEEHKKCVYFPSPPPPPTMCHKHSCHVT